MLTRHWLWVVVVVAGIALSGCSVVAPRYSPSIGNVEQLKNRSLQPVKVGSFAAAPRPAQVDRVSLRGAAMKSPYEGSYARYLQESLRQELELAGMLSSDAELEVSGVLVKNDFNAAGISVGRGEVQARFVVKNGDNVSFDREISVSHEWDSSFVGVVAVERGMEAYPAMIRKLLAALYADPDFLGALGR